MTDLCSLCRPAMFSGRTKSFCRHQFHNTTTYNVIITVAAKVRAFRAYSRNLTLSAFPNRQLTFPNTSGGLAGAPTSTGQRIELASASRMLQKDS